MNVPVSLSRFHALWVHDRLTVPFYCAELVACIAHGFATRRGDGDYHITDKGRLAGHQIFKGTPQCQTTTLSTR